jgi:hypothetical protein
VTNGKLCLVGYTSLTMCAQFEHQTFPQPGDLVFTLPAGTYTVTVHRMFAHQAGEQFPDEELDADDDHYIVVFAKGGKPIEYELRALGAAAGLSGLARGFVFAQRAVGALG